MAHCLLLVLVFLLLPCTAAALSPEDVLVVANQQVPEGVELARYYMRQRNIPAENLLLLDAPVTESCSRKDYEHRIAHPARIHLARMHPDRTQPKNRIRCLVTLYGLPLSIQNPDGVLADRESRDLDALLAEQAKLNQRLQNPSQEKDVSVIHRRLQRLNLDIGIFKKFDGSASLDSELALVRVPSHLLSGWIHNPCYIGNRDLPTWVSREAVLMVSRLDGPNAATVRRIIDDSLAAEKNGLEGVAFFDARFPESRETEIPDGYHLYDRAIHRAARLVSATSMPVVLDDRAELFQPGEARPAALYCGWYSLARYVDAFNWQQGAVGYHIASAECSTLKAAESQVWCKRMLEKGAAAVIGPVNEPFVQAFPPPDIFFAALTDGSLTLAECYLLSVPHFSWKMVLVGDPLYRPFSAKKHP
ncbi:TIGR03790 family protein [Desulfosarcina sp. OttesenSCG-928-G10]|nr:TIGR03790 family protein [Desulfosarcina sp. OttesenSCG-928-G10]MDL2321218.1 TIGR03790 family protein [Desulfosarcina sp. OttesenSCG-928-B08]